jgi:hypothetical protein
MVQLYSALKKLFQLLLTHDANVNNKANTLSRFSFIVSE